METVSAISGQRSTNIITQTDYLTYIHQKTY